MKRKPNGYWTKEKCHEEALKYDNKSDLLKYSNSAYNAIYKNGWNKELLIHMDEIKKPNGYWTKERCHKEALKYDAKCLFQLGSISAYHKAIKCGWLDDICSHMTHRRKQNNYWTKELCKEEALNCNSRRMFYEKYTVPYSTSVRKGWLDDICSHMVEIKPNYYVKWTYDICKEEAQQYNTRGAFKKGIEGAYNASNRNGWMVDFFPKK